MVTSEKRGNIEIVSFTLNKLDALVADEVREEVSRLFSEPNSRVIVNLKGIQYIDSTGFGFLLSILRSARNNYGTLKICSIEPDVNNLFQNLRLNTIFDIYGDVDECIKSFS
ncbi:MAG: STAS domain-containing protein [Bacteroidales bacterium]